MNVRPSTWLAAGLAAAALLAGCGSSGSTSSSNAPTATSSTAPAAGASTSPTPTTTSGSATAAPTAQAVASAIATCKQAIRAQTTLSARAKSKLEAVCAKAASGDQAAVKQAAKEVCEEVINGSAVPAGPAREQALSACKPK